MKNQFNQEQPTPEQIERLRQLSSRVNSLNTFNIFSTDQDKRAAIAGICLAIAIIFGEYSQTTFTTIGPMYYIGAPLATVITLTILSYMSAETRMRAMQYGPVDFVCVSSIMMLIYAHTNALQSRVIIVPLMYLGYVAMTRSRVLNHQTPITAIQFVMMLIALRPNVIAVIPILIFLASILLKKQPLTDNIYKPKF